MGRLLESVFPLTLFRKIFQETPDVEAAILAGAILLVSALIGWALERYIIRRLGRYAEEQGHPFLLFLSRSLKGILWIWIVLWGAETAKAGLPFTTGAEGPGSPNFSGVLDRLIQALFVLSLGVLASRIVAQWFYRYAARVPSGLPSTSIFVNILRAIVLTIALLMAMDAFGISIAPLLTGLGVGGLAVALALQPTLANLFAGLQVLSARQLRPGDFIELDNGQRGYVQDITWRTTTIRALTNSMIIIPNNQLANSMIINHYLPDRKVTIRIPVGVHYDSDLERVERIALEVLREMAQEVPDVDQDFEMRIRFFQFGDSSINFNAVFQVNEAMAQFSATHEFIKRLHKRFEQEGIEIPYPIRNIYMRTPVSLESEGSKTER
ncbi:MAG: mechanosensitive ion channel protein [Candidatus Poribacteria bacterium]|nr:MAG: mechanosensitive ion channel protein [Candidatus Poribacteria bacterium]